MHRNAKQSLARHKVARAGDLTARSQALQELQDTLELAEAPLRIECYDVSHVQGTQVVASMVVFEDGLPRKSEYRRFIVRGVDDRGHRRHRGDARGADPPVPALPRGARPGRPTSSSVPIAESGPSGSTPTPGGRTVRLPAQPRRRRRGAAAGQRRRRPPSTELGIEDVALVGLAKRLEEVWLPGQDYPVILPRTSEGLYLLQRVRDEAHRFAITFHRQRRSKAMTTSALDGIPGSARRGARRCCGISARSRSSGRRRSRRSRTSRASGLRWRPPLRQRLAHRRHAVPAVNVTTGEMLDGD